MRAQFFLPIMVGGFAIAVTGCSHGLTEQEKAVHDGQNERIEQLSSALSRSQSRLEELDARLSAVSDKLDAVRITLDHMSGKAPLKVQAVGTLKEEVELSATHKNDDKEDASLSSVANASSEDTQVTDDFKKAMELFLTAKYSEAEIAFHQITESYHHHILAGLAQFYAGECYFKMGEYKLAVSEYQKVLSNFSSSPRVPSALVRISHAYTKLGNTEEASRNMLLATNLYTGHPSLELSAEDSKE